MVTPLTKCLIAIPTFNDGDTLPGVVAEVLKYRQTLPLHSELLVIDDGSTDHTVKYLADSGVSTLRFDTNRGYGAAIRGALDLAVAGGFSHVITLDADGQHPPDLIPAFLRFAGEVPVVSGSRYLPNSPQVDVPPAPYVNTTFRRLVNTLLGLSLTDVGCGMKCISSDAAQQLTLTEDGFAVTLEFWISVSRLGLPIREVAVPMLYPGGRHIASRFNSPEVGCDYAVFVLVRCLAGCDDITYGPASYEALALRLARKDRRTIRRQTETILTILGQGQNAGLPAGRAIDRVLEFRDNLDT